MKKPYKSKGSLSPTSLEQMKQQNLCFTIVQLIVFLNLCDKQIRVDIVPPVLPNSLFLGHLTRKIAEPIQ